MISGQAAALLQEPLLLFPALVAAFTARGFARAWVAKKVGDPTPEQNGFLTLNPAAHVDTLATLVLVTGFVIFDLFVPLKLITTFFFLIILVLFGPRWNRPVPIDVSRLKQPRRDLALIAIAGSLGNLLCALAFLYAMRIAQLLALPMLFLKTFVQMCSVIADVSIFFGILFLLPIPPLDGFLVISYLFPKAEAFLTKIAPHSLLTIMLIVFFAQAIVFIPFILIKILLINLVLI